MIITDKFNRFNCDQEGTLNWQCQWIIAISHQHPLNVGYNYAWIIRFEHATIHLNTFQCLHCHQFPILILLLPRTQRKTTLPLIPIGVKNLFPQNGMSTMYSMRNLAEVQAAWKQFMTNWEHEFWRYGRYVTTEYFLLHQRRIYHMRRAILNCCIKATYTHTMEYVNAITISKKAETCHKHSKHKHQLFS